MVDARGCFRIVDRKKDMILVPGFNVFPNEVEDVLSRLAGVLECAVVGVPDAKTGEAVKLVIVKKDAGLTEADVRRFCELLTDARWLEARSLALGELSAEVKARKTAKGASITMTRRVRRDLPALVAMALPTESDLQFEATWTQDGDGYTGTLAMDIVGQPAKMTAKFVQGLIGDAVLAADLPVD